MSIDILRILFLVLSFFVLPLANLYSQSPHATIQGTIRHAANQLPLEGATIHLFPNDNFVISNHKGAFQFENLPIDQYQIRVSFIGFDTLFIPGISPKAGKTTVLDLRLRPGTTQLGEVIVRGSALPVVEPLSAHVLSIEETLRFPATFFDPARLATSFAGVANVNDQANALSIRGNSPNGLIWRLEGRDIVNPNHTSNAGTFGDRMAQSSGGVNILSALGLELGDEAISFQDVSFHLDFTLILLSH